jgi:hypothetical protein
VASRATDKSERWSQRSASGAIFISQGIFDEQFNPDGGKGGGPGNLAPSAPAGLAQEVIYSQVSAFLVVHSAHSRRLTCVNISGYLVGWVIENDCSARRTSQRFQGGCLPGAD